MASDTTEKLHRLVNGEEPSANDSVPVDAWRVEPKEGDVRIRLLDDAASTDQSEAPNASQATDKTPSRDDDVIPRASVASVPTVKRRPKTRQVDEVPAPAAKPDAGGAPTP